nr:uncharacterized protein LOC102447707 [Pelodiscus sinensis]|eukprot:XP_025046138.1 uncharacterized protein LOC102447707 [Pelodiscus sinensis]
MRVQFITPVAGFCWLICFQETLFSNADDACAKSTVCPSYATCKVIPGGYRCACKWGSVSSTGEQYFMDNSVTCQDIDECAQDPLPCGPNASCQNTDKSFVYIDECSHNPSPCGPNSNCTNTQGSYNCTCRPGYLPPSEPDVPFYCTECPKTGAQDKSPQYFKMPGSPGFKKCSICRDSMPLSDGHSACVRCLGETHIPQKCGHCAKLTSRARKERERRLKEILFNKALMPSTSAGSSASDPTLEKRRAPSPKAPSPSRKRASPAKSLPIAPQPRGTAGGKPGASGSRAARAPAGKKPPGTSKPRPQPAPQEPLKGPAPSAPTLPVPSTPASSHSSPRRELSSALCAPGEQPADQMPASSHSFESATLQPSSQEQLPPQTSRAPSHSHARVLSCSPSPEASSHTLGRRKSCSRRVSSHHHHHRERSCSHHRRSRSRSPSRRSTYSSRRLYYDRHGSARASKHSSPARSARHGSHYHDRCYDEFSRCSRSRSRCRSPCSCRSISPGSTHSGRQRHPSRRPVSSPRSPTPRSQQSDLEEGQLSESEPDKSPNANSSVSSAVKVITPSESSLPDDLKEFQDLFRRVAQSQEVQITETQGKQHKLFKNLHPKQQRRIALPIDEAIMEVAEDIWQTPTSVPPTNKRVDKKYFVPSKGLDFLFNHPQPNSLIVDAVCHKTKTSHFKNSLPDKDSKKLDSFGRKVYSSSTLLLRIANYAALLSNHNFDNYSKLPELMQYLPDSKKHLLKAVVQEGFAACRTSLQIAADVADTAARAMASRIAMRRAAYCTLLNSTFRALGEPYEEKNSTVCLEVRDSWVFYRNF